MNKKPPVPIFIMKYTHTYICTNVYNHSTGSGDCMLVYHWVQLKTVSGIMHGVVEGIHHYSAHTCTNPECKYPPHPIHTIPSSLPCYQI